MPNDLLQQIHQAQVQAGEDVVLRQLASMGLATPQKQLRRARKVGGNYQANGTVVSEFHTTAGKLRYVFEFDEPRGMLHIFTPEQLEITP